MRDTRVSQFHELDVSLSHKLRIRQLNSIRANRTLHQNKQNISEIINFIHLLLENIREVDAKKIELNTPARELLAIQLDR